MPSIPPDWADAISRAMRGDFGPPGKSLQQDIADELADHLSQSMDRERRSGKSEDEAKDRVLNRFGSPNLIAARLWFDGMKGEIMFQRWMIGMTAAAMIIAVVTSVFAFWSMEQNNKSLLAAVEKLDQKIDQRISAAKSLDWVTLDFKCIDDATGQPLKDVVLKLSGGDLNSVDRELTVKTDKEGMASLGPLRPGNPRFKIVVNEDWEFNGDLKIRPGHNDEILLRCPVEIGSPTELQMKLPEVLRGDDKAVFVALQRYQDVDGRMFVSPYKIYRILLPSGRIFANDFEQMNDGPYLTTTDRSLEIPSGNYHVNISFRQREKGWDADQAINEVHDQLVGLKENGIVLNLRTSKVAEYGKSNDWMVPSPNELPKRWQPDHPPEIPLPHLSLPKTENSTNKSRAQPPMTPFSKRAENQTPTPPWTGKSELFAPPANTDESAK